MLCFLINFGEVKQMNINPKQNEIYAKRSVNIGDASVDIDILIPDKLAKHGWRTMILPKDFYDPHTRLGKMLNKAIADYLTKSDDYVVCGMNKDGSLK